ncbi:staphylococcal nuclease domain protein, putative [Talaromyces stipitatus ATCC 10500]|uniref:Probable endonuclease LCL3 n=1 Tax=Talaromyces stipitatus (strain ATCC 10500 / CBS 375.48 / QM 6759 / NRRL 1006) TaxID=441959 RepID=B8MH74_TALSN|nr:staphylococcal nuclease domain protein, putative [Talaromyces stipitatus ATCC 10500]EED16888.1 staphylococcal nuclease domain protein, putative [Talaromyces stipitatus ATCC 10500]
MKYYINRGCKYQGRRTATLTPKPVAKIAAESNWFLRWSSIATTTLPWLYPYLHITSQQPCSLNPGMGWWPFGASGSTSDPEDKNSNDSHHHSSSDHKQEEQKQSFIPPLLISHSSSSSKSTTDWNSSLNAFDWSQFKEPQNLIPTALLTGGILFVVYVQRRYLRRFPEATDITSSYFRQRSLLGRVTSVGDGDNFRMYHTPGGRLVGWGWLPWMKVPTAKKELKDRTVHIRLAGIDAPELAHFGRPAQPYSHEAHMWLTSYLINRRVRAYVHRPDQYKRVIATVYVRRWLDIPPLRRRDVSYEMLRRGLATVYEAKSGVEFGGTENERKYREAERLAKSRKLGLWKDFWRQGGVDFESPRAYKTRMGKLETSSVESSSPVEKRPSGFISLLVGRIWPFGSKKDGK